MGFFSRTKQEVTNTSTDIDLDFYTPTGVEGEGNNTLGANAQDYSQEFGAGSFAPGAPVDNRYFEDTGDIFAPLINFFTAAPASNSNPALDAARLNYQTQTGNYNESDASFLNWWEQNGSSYALGDYPADQQLVQALADSGDQRAAGLLSQYGTYSPPPASSGPTANTANLADAENSFFSGGPASGAIASGEDSLAFQAGGPASLGDYSPVFAAPVSGLAIGGDADISAPVVTAPLSGQLVTVGGDNNAPQFAGEVSAPVVTLTGDNSAPIITGDTAAPVITTGGDVDAPIITGTNSAPITGGNVEAPIITGTNSAPIISGDNSAPIISGGNSAPILGGDSSAPIISGENTAPIISGEVTAPIISGNSGAVTIYDSSVASVEAALKTSAQTVTAALAAANANTEAAFDATNRALAGAFEFRKDPAQAATENSNKTLIFAVLGLAALFTLTR